MTLHKEALARAVLKMSEESRESIDRLNDLATDEIEDQFCSEIRRLHRTVRLVEILSELVTGCTAQQIHAAFGAPGDWGYETPLGDALHRIYRDELC